MTTALHSSGLAVSGARTSVPARRFSSVLARALAGAIATRRDRQRLAALDDHTLADIGVSRAEALAEARRPIWDVPAHWLK